MNVAEERAFFLGELRKALVRALNGHPITAAQAWDILREWDGAFPEAEWFEDVTPPVTSTDADSDEGS